MKAIKITNPVWLGEVAPKINDYTDKVKVQGIDYVSMFQYFRNVVQFGGDMAEFWVVMDGGKPVAFSSWSVRQLPYVASALMENAYKWVRDHKPVELLTEEFFNFALKHRCTTYYARCNNKYIAKLLDNISQKNKLTFDSTGAIECIMKKER